MEWFRGTKTKIRKKPSAKDEDDAVHYRIMEYQKLRFFWEEFGLSPLDLGHMEESMPGWLEDMMTIGAARSTVEAEKLQSTSANFEPQAPLSMGAQAKGLGGTGKQVIRRKLM